MHIEFDGPISSANAHTLRQVIEALLERIQARDEGLDLSPCRASSSPTTCRHRAAARRHPGGRRAPVAHRRRRGGLALLFDGASCGRSSKATAPRSPA
jgi:hypothetical protein